MPVEVTIVFSASFKPVLKLRCQRFTLLEDPPSRGEGHGILHVRNMLRLELQAPWNRL